MKKRINYLNNKDMLAEIHKSKNSFCVYDDPKYSMFDAIVVQAAEAIGDQEFPLTPVPLTPEIITDEVIAAGKKARASRMTAASVAKYLEENPTGVKKNAPKTLPDDIDTDDLVYRVISYEHIPLQPGRKKNPKTVADTREKMNFAPFRHYILVEGELVEVGRSHWKDGEYSLHHGSITNTLAKMFMMLVQRYSQRSNWRGYTYVEEMKGQALLQLSTMGLQFNEHKSDNPFAYYTTSISNAFTRVLNIEKSHQEVRDDLLEQQGQTPSFTRQLAHEEQIRQLRDASGSDEIS